jgi:hypothetical protein
MKTQSVIALCAVTAVLGGGCMFHNKQYEEMSPKVEGTKFKTIATLAGTSYQSDIRLMVHVRQELREAGWNAVPRSGRWDTERKAVAEICAPGSEEPIDGVLFVTYNHLVLYDCQTGIKAYDVRSSPQAGGLTLADITQRLMRYLRGEIKKPLPRRG